MARKAERIVFALQIGLLFILVGLLVLGRGDLVVLNWKVLLDGAKTTILLTLTTYALGLCLAMLLAMIRFHAVPILGKVVAALVEVIRAVPQLMVIFWIYFGIPHLTEGRFSPLMAAFVSLLIISTAYISEVLRAGFIAIPKSQFEAAYSLAHSFYQAHLYIIIPQVLRNMYPALVGQLVMLFKITSLLYVIGVIDFYRAVNIVNNREYIPIEAFLLLVLFYYFFGVVFIRLGALFGKEVNY